MSDEVEDASEQGGSKPQGLLAGAALKVTYLILIPILVTVYLMLGFVWSFCYTQISLGNKLFTQPGSFSSGPRASEATIGLLEAVDGILIMSVAVLIVFGTIWINILAPRAEDNLPSALQGLTSGKLKEKLSSSLITASAVYLFKIVIQLTSDGGGAGNQITLKNFAIFGTIHLLFIIGYFVIAQSNRLDPHKQPASHKASPSEPPTH